MGKTLRPYSEHQPVPVGPHHARDVGEDPFYQGWVGKVFLRQATVSPDIIAMRKDTHLRHVPLWSSCEINDLHRRVLSDLGNELCSNEMLAGQLSFRTESTRPAKETGKDTTDMKSDSR